MHFPLYQLAFDGTYKDVDEQFVIKWNDPNWKFEWPHHNPILYGRDGNHLKLSFTLHLRLQNDNIFIFNIIMTKFLSKITLITATLNSENYIKQTLDSIIAQKYPFRVHCC